MNAQQLEEFIHYLPGHKEVALVLSRDAVELADLAEALAIHGFSPTYSVQEWLTKSQEESTYLLADGVKEGEAKDLYDLAVQYPTGQVQVWNPATSALVSVPLSYQGTPPVLLTTLQNLHTLEAQGFDLRSASGLAFQSS